MQLKSPLVAWHRLLEVVIYYIVVFLPIPSSFCEERSESQHRQAVEGRVEAGCTLSI